MKVEIEGDPLPVSMEFEFQQVYDGDSSPINMGPEFQQDTDTCHDDVLQAMLKRKRIPRNWGEKELKQLIELYHLSGGERKGIGNLYKQITEATGSPKIDCSRSLTSSKPSARGIWRTGEVGFY